jgi:hypothetical protein
MRSRASIGLALFGALALFSASACGDDDVDSVEGDESVFNAEVGECFEEFEEGTSEDAPEVDCDEPHVVEVFHLFDVDDGDFPGQDELTTEAQDVCQGEPFEDYVGVPYDETSIGVAYLTPTEDSWEADDREVVCLVGLGGEPVEGSLEGEGPNYPPGSDTGTPGDDDDDVQSQIDALVPECEGGDNEACDLLYSITPIGSSEEEIGATCGGRSDVPLNGECANTLGD